MFNRVLIDTDPSNAIFGELSCGCHVVDRHGVELVATP
jgi:hypothetical protein